MIDVDCYCTQARRVARQLTALYDRGLAPSGLKVTQFSLLRAITRLPRASMAALTDATGLERTTLVRNLSVLERDGFIAQTPVQTERAPVIVLTTQGLAAMETAVPLWDAVQAQARAILSDANLAPLRTLSNALETLA